MCPICSNSTKNNIGKPRISKKAKQFIRQDYKIVQCKNCRFYYVDPALDLSQKEWQILYDSDYFVTMTKWHAEKRKQDLVTRLNKLQHFSAIPVNTFLDLGSGEGYGLIESLNRGWQTYGIDISDLRIVEAKDPKIVFKQANLIDAKFGDDFFDCIYVDSVLEHVPNPMELLKELNRIIKPGGAIYVGVPNEDSLSTRFLQFVYNLVGRSSESSRLKPFAPSYHIGGFNKASLTYAAHKADMKIVKLKNFASKTDILNNSAFNRDFLVSAVLLPISLLAVPLRMELYYAAYLSK